MILSKAYRYLTFFLELRVHVAEKLEIPACKIKPVINETMKRTDIYSKQKKKGIKKSKIQNPSADALKARQLQEILIIYDYKLLRRCNSLIRWIKELSYNPFRLV